MKLISMFEKNGTTYVKDDEGNIYALQKITPPSSPTPKVINDATSNIDINLIKKINKMLVSLNVPYYASYDLLVHCIYFAVTDETCRERLYVNLYPKVARLHNVMASSVPSSFTTLTCHWSRTKEYKEIFGDKLVSPKILILSLANHFASYK